MCSSVNLSSSCRSARFPTVRDEDSREGLDSNILLRRDGIDEHGVDSEVVDATNGCDASPLTVLH